MPRLEDIPPELVANAVALAVVEAVARGGDAETVVQRALARAKTELGLGTDVGTGGSALHSPGHAQPCSAPTPPPSVEFTPPAPSANEAHAPAALGSGKAAGGVRGGGRPVITEGDVLDAVRAGRTEVLFAPGTIVTALARDAARDAGLRLVEG